MISFSQLYKLMDEMQMKIIVDHHILLDVYEKQILAEKDETKQAILMEKFKHELNRDISIYPKNIYCRRRGLFGW